MKRIFIFGVVALILIGVGIGAYFYFFANKAKVVVAPLGGTSLPAAGQAQGTDTGSADSGADAGQGDTSGLSPVVVSSQLVKVAAGPVVPGFAAIDVSSTTASSSPGVRVEYLDRQSGNVYAYSTSAGNITRINNRTLPGIERALWTPSGSTAFVQFLSTDTLSSVSTYALPASGGDGSFLSQDLTDIAVSSAGVLTLASGVNGSIASLGRFDGTHPTPLFTTPLSMLRIGFAGKNRYLAFSKPSATLPGYAFLVDSSGHFSRVAGPANGLVALASPSGKWIIVSSISSGNLQMQLVNTMTGEAISLPVATIADKCVWTSDEATVYCGIPVTPATTYAYPDDWYQGAAHFNDRVWKIDVAGRYAKLVLDLSTVSGAPFDVIAPTLDSSGTLLVFQNKNDGSLWSYKL